MENTVITWQYFFQTIEEAIDYLKLNNNKQSRALGEKIDFIYTHLPMLPTKKTRQNKFKD